MPVALALIVSWRISSKPSLPNSHPGPMSSWLYQFWMPARGIMYHMASPQLLCLRLPVQLLCTPLQALGLLAALLWAGQQPRHSDQYTPH